MSRVRRSMFATAFVQGMFREMRPMPRPLTSPVITSPVIKRLASGPGMCSGSSIVPKVLPGTPATARMPCTRSG